MKKVKILILILAGSIMISTSACSEDGGQVSIIFLPFDAETYEPVTLHNLVKQADCDIKVDKEDKRLKSILEIIKNNKEYIGFDYSFVRGRITNLVPNGDIFFDKHKGILNTANYSAGVLTDKGFDEFKKVITSIVDESRKEACIR